MSKSKHKVVLKRHTFYRNLIFPFIKLLALIKGYKNKSHFKIRKGESYLILSNHQTDLDGIFIMLTFNKILYAVTTDTVMSNGFTSKLISHCFGMIPKKKGIVDFEANKKMLLCFMEGGSLLLFPEGNRTYAEFQYYINENFPKFVKSLKCSLILFRLEGGTGTQPRFKFKRRKGKFTGRITKVLKYDEYKDIPDEELLKIIKDGIRFYDSESGQLFKSKTRAQYLERIFFVCPKCGAMHKLVSHE